MRAVSVQGPGPAALVQATPGGPPSAPEGLSAAPGDRQAVLSWSAPENDGGSAVTGYEVRHAEGATVPANTAWTSVELVTTHTVTGLDNGELHSFEVRAVSARGGGRAARIQATPVTKPYAPQELTARASAGRVDLTWSAPADDGGFDILRYEIRHAKGASVPNDTAWTELQLYTTYYFASLDNGAQYSFEVRAVSVQGPGPAALVQATPGGPPTAPEGLSAAPGDRQAVLSWSAPENDGGFCRHGLRGAPRRRRHCAREHGMDFGRARHDPHRHRPGQRRAAQLRSARGERAGRRPGGARSRRRRQRSRPHRKN